METPRPPSARCGPRVGSARRPGGVLGAPSRRVGRPLAALRGSAAVAAAARSGPRCRGALPPAPGGRSARWAFPAARRRGPGAPPAAPAAAWAGPGRGRRGSPPASAPGVGGRGPRSPPAAGSPGGAGVALAGLRPCPAPLPAPRRVPLPGALSGGPPKAWAAAPPPLGGARWRPRGPPLKPRAPPSWVKVAPVLLLILCARVCPGASLVAVPPGVPAGGLAVKGQDKRRTALDGLPPAR